MDYDSRFAEARALAEMEALEDELAAAEVAVFEAGVQVGMLEVALKAARRSGDSERIHAAQFHLDDAMDEQFAAEADRASAWVALNGPSWEPEEDEVQTLRDRYFDAGIGYGR